MDYLRIYREFIADRKGREGQIVGYSERHHIVPVALGGTNHPENLVRLSPECHIFAHILLAKTYGGKMWAPVQMMLGNWARDKVPSRREIRLAALARQMHARSLVGAGNTFYGKSHTPETLSKLRDDRTYEVRSFSGEVFRGTRLEIGEKTGLSQRQVHRLVAGDRASVGDWYNPERNPTGATRSERLSQALRSKDSLVLFHHDGREWVGSLVEFRNEFGVQFLLQSPDGHCAGWYTTKVNSLCHSDRVRAKTIKAASARGDISGSRNPMFDSDRRKDLQIAINHDEGETYSGSLMAFADQRGIDPVTYGRMRKTLMGKRTVGGYVVKSFRGWRLAS